MLASQLGNEWPAHAVVPLDATASIAQSDVILKLGSCTDGNTHLQPGAPKGFPVAVMCASLSSGKLPAAMSAGGRPQVAGVAHRVIVDINACDARGGSFKQTYGATCSACDCSTDGS